jgi:hypothetical protein
MTRVVCSCERCRQLAPGVRENPVLQAILAHGAPVGAAAAAKKRDDMLGPDAAAALAKPGARSRKSIKFDWQHLASCVETELAGRSQVVRQAECIGRSQVVRQAERIPLPLALPLISSPPRAFVTSAV